MNRYKKFLSVLLSVVIAFSMSTVAFASDNNYKNEAPIIFLHGMFGWGGEEGINDDLPYWGASTGSLTDYLTNEGYECYSASVGPLTSAWDDACVLYAQIIGGTVDYGEVHSEREGHLRYGRTYKEALVPDWGKLDANGKVQKIHLIGHSFGGIVIRTLTYLLTYGCEEEINASKENVSGLFTGGKENWINSCVTICTPHNGTTAFYAARDLNIIPILKAFSYTYAAIMGRSLLNGRKVDFHLEQFGLTDIPGEKNADSVYSSVKNFYNSNDCVAYALSMEGCKKTNEMIDISKNVYYFSYAVDSTESLTLNEEYRYVKYAKLSLLKVLSVLLMLKCDFTDEDNNITIDKSWYANDGLVNVVSALHPFDEPFTSFDATNIQKGIWNVMEVEKGDHGTVIGLLADADKTHEFYNYLVEMLVSIEN